MSRIGNAPVALPQGVEVKFNNGEVSVKGKLGELKQEISEIDIDNLKPLEALLILNKLKKNDCFLF